MFEKVTVKYNGQYHEFVLQDLDLATPQNPNDSDLKAAIALNIPGSSFVDYVVSPPESERLAGQHNNITTLNIHPVASYASL